MERNPTKLVISNASRAWGGAEAMAETLARGFQQRGHDVVVFCRRDGSPLQERLSGDVPCEPLLGGFDLHPPTLWFCARALRRHGTEAVITNAVKDPRLTGVVARMLGIPVVFRQETDHPYKNVLRHRLFYGWVPDRHLVNSEATRRTLLASVDWVPAERVVVIPNGVDVSPIVEAAPADLALPDGAVAIGFVGRFEERKGIWSRQRRGRRWRAWCRARTSSSQAGDLRRPRSARCSPALRAFAGSGSATTFRG
jgi:glycosyltransferase involved in cell wall biosynthesis